MGSDYLYPRFTNIFKYLQRTGLNIDGITSYRTRAPYPSFAESFKMMPKTTSSGMTTALAHKRHHHHHNQYRQYQNGPQQKDNLRPVHSKKFLARKDSKTIHDS